MKLIEALEKNLVDDVGWPFIERIESLVSKLYLTEAKVYKAYKWDKNFFGDFSNHDFRREFITDDLLWNTMMSPEVYLVFQPMRYDNSRWIKVNDAKESEDILIVMRKITGESLTKLLHKNTITRDMLEKLARVMTTRVDALTPRVRLRHEEEIKKGWKSLLLASIEGAKEWSLLVDPFVPKAWSWGVIDRIEEVLEKNSYIGDFSKENLVAAVDNHSDNVYFEDGQPVFLDVMLPRPEWRIVDPFSNICKLASDVGVFIGQKGIDPLYQVYSQYHQLPSEDIRLYYETWYGFLKAIYVVLNNEKQDFEHYRKFIDERLSKFPNK